jgi:hypothetical protein
MAAQVDRTQALRAVSRVIGGCCFALATPLALIALAWLPAEVLAARQFVRGFSAAGTPSFHESMAAGLSRSLVTIALLAAGSAAWLGFAAIAARPPIDPRI